MFNNWPCFEARFTWLSYQYALTKQLSMLLLGKAAERNFNGFHDCAKSAEVGYACISNKKVNFY